MIDTPVESLDLELIQQFGNVELLARYVVEGFITGLHKSPFHGFSVEFAEHRIYNQGESTRHIDWRLFGRTEKLFVKKFEEETNLRCLLLIDNSSSMYFPSEKYNKLHFSIYCAASIINLLKKQRDAVGLSLFSEGLESFITPKSSYAHIQYLYSVLNQQLHNKEKNKKTSTANTLHTIAEAIHKRSLVIIFSDMFENIQTDADIFAGLQHLRYNKHEVIVFHVMDKSKELDFDFENRPYKFVDLESDARVNLFPNEIRADYVQRMEETIRNLKVKCSQYHIDYIEADINKGFFQVLQAYLIKRSKMN